jgi:hypothetical protein
LNHHSWFAVTIIHSGIDISHEFYILNSALDSTDNHQGSIGLTIHDAPPALGQILPGLPQQEIA